MRGFFLVSVTFLAASTGIAFAGEGNGDPFPGPDFAVVTRSANAKLAMRGQDPFSYAAGGTTMALGSYRQAVAKNQDPFPFAASAAIVGQRSTAGNPSTLAQGAAAGTHG